MVFVFLLLLLSNFADGSGVQRQLHHYTTYDLKKFELIPLLPSNIYFPPLPLCQSAEECHMYYNVAFRGWLVSGENLLDLRQHQLIEFLMHEFDFGFYVLTFEYGGIPSQTLLDHLLSSDKNFDVLIQLISKDEIFTKEKPSHTLLKKMRYILSTEINKQIEFKKNFLTYLEGSKLDEARKVFILENLSYFNKPFVKCVSGFSFHVSSAMNHIKLLHVF